MHTFENRGTVDVRFRDLHSPAIDFQEYIETLLAILGRALRFHIAGANDPGAEEHC